MLCDKKKSCFASSGALVANLSRSSVEISNSSSANPHSAPSSKLRHSLRLRRQTSAFAGTSADTSPGSSADSSADASADDSSDAMDESILESLQSASSIACLNQTQNNALSQVSRMTFDINQEDYVAVKDLFQILDAVASPFGKSHYLHSLV